MSARSPSRSDVGHPEELADDRHGQRVGEGLDEVDVAVHPVEQPGGDLLDPWPEPLDRPGRERLADQPPQPGVVGRIAVEHVGGELGGLHPRVGRGRGAMHGLADGRRVLAEPGVGEGLPGVVVAGDEPHADPVGHHDLDGGALGAQRAVDAVRIPQIIVTQLRQTVRHARLPSPHL